MTSRLGVKLYRISWQIYLNTKPVPAFFSNFAYRFCSGLQTFCQLSVLRTISWFWYIACSENFIDPVKIRIYAIWCILFLKEWRRPDGEKNSGVLQSSICVVLQCIFVVLHESRDGRWAVDHSKVLQDGITFARLSHLSLYSRGRSDHPAAFHIVVMIWAHFSQVASGIQQSQILQ